MENLRFGPGGKGGEMVGAGVIERRSEGCWCEVGVALRLPVLCCWRMVPVLCCWWMVPVSCCWRMVPVSCSWRMVPVS